ncbi:hypothetical protein TorRG33x02_135670 [Trema orientale]|uniref:F-box protein At3g26010-like beta-propeller domain-containing protein n=1 Tax=Trema orientale TaxID=63057 RepID=A0A2P5EYV3_TREOI|nr:hypothetical protein TorRG33x02_135670 [Trema orientale]
MVKQRKRKRSDELTPELALVRRSSVRLKSKVDDDDDDDIEETVATKFMSIVTDDLLLEILVRLPHLRFLIQSSTYIHPFYELFSEKSKILNGRSKLPSSSSITTSATYLNFLPFNSVRLLASFDDLLLVSNDLKSVGGDDCYYVCNPLTRQWVKLPQPSIELDIWHPGCCGLVCKRKLGYTDINSQYSYKIVLITRDWNDGNEFCVTIFCSEVGKWSTTKLLSSRPFDAWDRFALAFVASNGIIYWTLKRTISLVNGVNVPVVKAIIGFDSFNNDSTDPKRCRIIDRPVDFVGGWHSYKDKVSLGLVRGQLRLS